MNNLFDYPRLLLKLRSIALIVYLAFLSLGLPFKLIDSRQFLLGLIILIPFFILNQLLLRVNINEKFNLLQVVMDFFLAATLIYICGGLKNPLNLILIIHFFVAPFFLRGKQNIIAVVLFVAILIVLSSIHNEFSINLTPEANRLLPQISLLIIGISIWLIARKIVQETLILQRGVEKLKNYNGQLDKFRALGLLSAGVCHEMGTPLNTIQLKLGQIKREQNLNDDKDIAIIERNLNKTILALHSLNAHVHDENKEFYRDQTDLKSLIGHLSGKYYGIDIEKRLYDGDDFLVELPKLLLFKGIDNILRNSVEAGATKIIITLFRDENYFNLTFEDDGCGFNKESLVLFGKPFISTKDLGTGLGIYQLINLLNLIEGKINFLNSDIGAKIVIRIPFKEKL